MHFTLAPISFHQQAGVVKLLANAGLPHADIELSLFAHYLGATAPDGTLVGAIGMEPAPPCALLRSLVVHPDMRGQGLGTQLLAALEQKAGAAGITQLYLLTQTAAPFFSTRGYHPCQRDQVPAVIGQTGEFQNICPQSATCLSKCIGARCA